MPILEQIAERFGQTDGVKTAVACLRNGHTPCLVSGMCAAARPFFLFSLLAQTGRKGLFVVPEEKEAYQLQKILSAVLPRVYVYPAKDFIFENITSYSRENEHERLRILSAVADGNYDAVVTVPDALMQFTLSPDGLKKRRVDLKIGESLDLEDLTRLLEENGYQRGELVEGPGQYAVHGGILDVFSPQYDYPVRADFFGDEIDRVAFFDRYTQRTVSEEQEACLLPCAELLADDEGRKRVAEEYRALSSFDFPLEKYREEIRQSAETLAETGRVTYPDRYAALLYPERFTLLDAMGDAVPVVFESKKVKERAEGFFRETYGVCESLAERGLLRLKSGLPFADADTLLDRFKAHPRTLLADLFPHTGIAFAAKTECTLSALPLDPLSERLQKIGRELASRLEESPEETVVFFASGDYAAEHFAEEADLETNGDPALKGRFILKPQSLRPGFVHILPAVTDALRGGFTLPSVRLTVLTEDADAYDYPARAGGNGRGKRKGLLAGTEKIRSYTDLTEGELVVHVNHGIGRFVGIQTMTAAGVTRDFIKLVYADGGILYVPCDQMDLVSRYVGSDAAKLNKLGGSEWKKAKIRAKTSASSIAKDLIRLYAERMNRPGFAFPPDDAFQTVFESEFEYEETEGQEQASKEIKADMERPCPMDRLLCGDVGFGKTEVALRAAFKCVFAGKQVAILAPTTILSLQHFQTVTARFRGYPVEIGMLSRFVPRGQQQRYIEDLAKGKLNIVIGTHRLLQKDVKFKDLGLLIVDEEQRFGVKHKETLKEMTKSVDVLTLSATPIPRTLNMALSGIRDMSILEEAPVDRVPVQTFVMEYDETALEEAVRREFRRGGQVFYLYNYTESIYSKAAKLKEKFPDRSIAVAHGQMDKDDLSVVWKKMMDGEIDMLVCTTIIETGVNLPNANTLIIEDANRMGLSQLHQIRGRVGRSSRKAYAYLTYRRDAILSEVAEKRLQAIQEYTEFGSGFKIAMRDLQLRGAGNILGAEQSGQLEAIGYDLYVRILEDAVNLEKGLEPTSERNCIVDLQADAYVPDSYVPSQKVRMELYKRIGDLQNGEDAKDAEQELLDRFGPLPQPVSDLLRISVIRHAAMDLGFTSVEQKESTVCFFHPSADRFLSAGLLSDPAFRGRVMASPGGRSHIALRIVSRKSGELLRDIGEFLSVCKKFSISS